MINISIIKIYSSLFTGPKELMNMCYSHVRLPKLTIQPMQLWKHGDILGVICSCYASTCKVINCKEAKLTNSVKVLICTQMLALSKISYDSAFGMLKSNIGKNEFVVKSHVIKKS